MEATVVKLESPVQVFIGGTGRSGTTILGKIFSMHPDIVIYQEPNIYHGVDNTPAVSALIKGEISIDNFVHNMNNGIRDKLIKSLEFQFENPENFFSPETVLSFIEKSFTPTHTLKDAIAAFVDSLYHHGVEVFQRKYWVDKTPYNMHLADMLNLLFPNMKFIHIIRDPKDVACSYIPRHFGPNDLKTFIPWYKKKMIEGFEVMQRVPYEKYLIVSLEKLVSEPVSQIKKIFEFTEIPLPDEYLTAVVSPLNVNDSHNARWRNELSAEEAMAVNSICGPVYNLWKQLAI